MRDVGLRSASLSLLTDSVVDESSKGTRYCSARIRRLVQRYRSSREPGTVVALLWSLCVSEILMKWINMSGVGSRSLILTL